MKTKKTNQKTLLISEIFPPIHGGSGRWFWELYNRLPKEEYFIAAGDSIGAKKFDANHNLNITRIPLSSNSWGLKSVNGLLFYLVGLLHIRKLIKKYRITRVHCGRCLPEGVFGYLCYKLYKIPYISYVHGEDVETARSSRELSFIVKHTLKNASKLITNSNNTKNILIDHWHIPPNKINVLNPGMDSKKFTPKEYSFKIRGNLNWHDRPVILTVGRLQKRKGHDVLIKALPAIKKLHPDILYSIIGKGEEFDSLSQLVKNLDLQNNVQFLSEISDHTMIECYQQCTLFILPNRTVGRDIEGFGMVLAEAQSCGKVVIAGNSGGTSETMIIDKTGYIIDCTTPKKLEKLISSLLNKTEQLITMGKDAREHAKNNLDWEEHTKKAKYIFN